MPDTRGLGLMNKMRSIQKWQITSLSVALLLALSLQAQGKIKLRPLFTDREIQKAIIQTLGKPFFVDEADQKIHYLAGYFDLNDYGKFELIVWAGCCGYGGTGGYQLLVFTSQQHNLKLHSIIDFAWTPVIIQTAKRKGWHDIVLQIGSGGAPFEYAVSHFNGKKYEIEPQEIKRRQIKGKRLMGKHRVMTIVGPLPLIR